MNMYRNLPPTMNSDNHKAQPQEMVKTIFGEIEEIEDEVGREFRCFKNFEVVSSAPNDHHYFMNLEYIGFGVKKARYKERMNKERCLLAKHIPSSIFVRAYEFRDDLMRAAFIGPPGSDYQHCLFFFDIYFPITYPAVPPKLHYLSYGIDLNPNLRPEGRVCLNIQETWQDRLQQMCFLSNNNKGKWNPKESNFLYVLNEIHNLIAHPSPKPSPYSIHAVSGLREEHNAKNFASSCEKMTMVLRKPPVGFEFFVAGHFRQRAHPVLLKFKENNHDDRHIELFIRMFTAFERNGAYCKHHLDFLKSRETYQISAEDLDVLKSRKHQITTEDLSFSKPRKRQISLWEVLMKVDEEDSPQNQESGQLAGSYMSYGG